MDRLELVKYEGLGNDFLIALGAGAAGEVSDDEVRALCDRHRGVGADGLIELSSSADGLVMRLRNADGSPAETSGNGLRCAALAAFDAGLATGRAVRVLTDAGVRLAELLEGGEGAALLRVEMGEVLVSAFDSPRPGKQAYLVDVGNPHLVLLGDELSDVDLERDGAELSALRPGGLNVEVVVARARDELELTVYERGVGVTEACGTGSVAAAAAAHLAARADRAVRVRNPGGTLAVDLAGDDPARPVGSLTGPARRIASIEVRTADLVPVEVGTA